MTSTTPPMDHGTPSSSLLTDERGLERLFRAHFTPLVEQARGELDTAAQAAPRVVEGAFKHVWEERARFQTPAELEAFLHDSVHHGAARELSRRASVHHYHSSAPAKKAADAPPNVDESWSRVSRALHVGEGAAEANAEVSQHLKHDAAEHVAAMAKKASYKLPITITIVGAALALTGLYLVKQAGVDRSIMRALNDPGARTSIAPGGQMAIVNLDDAIKATSSPETRLTVPKNYGPNLRAVKLEGGPARFEVQPDQKQPFQVRAFSTAILVTGTDFTVRAVAADSSALVYVREGTVSVRTGDSVRTVAKGGGIAVTAGKFRDVTPGEKEELTTWSDGNLTISGRQLRVVLPELKRWYGLDIKVPDLPLLDRSVTIHAPLDSPQAAITEVEKSAGLKFGYEGKTMVFRDGAKKK